MRIMQIMNIVAGSLLAVPMLQKWAGKGGDQVEAARAKLALFDRYIGWVTLVLGIAGLIERLGIFSFGYIGSSFPQAIPAILIGLLLLRGEFERYPAIANFTAKIAPYEKWIGLCGVAVGLGSLLFGCIAPFCYPLYF